MRRYHILSTVIDQPEFYQISLASGFWNGQTFRYVPVNAEACGYIGSGRPNTKTRMAISKLSQLALWNLIILFPSWHNVLGKENRKSGEVEDILFFFGSKPWRHNCHRQALQKTARWQAEGKWVSYKRHADTQQFCWTTMSSWLLPCYTDKGLLKALGIHSWRTNCLWVIWISLWNCALCAFCFAQIMILIKKADWRSAGKL